MVTSVSRPDTNGSRFCRCLKFATCAVVESSVGEPYLFVELPFSHTAGPQSSELANSEFTPSTAIASSVAFLAEFHVGAYSAKSVSGSSGAFASDQSAHMETFSPAVRFGNSSAKCDPEVVTSSRYTKTAPSSYAALRYLPFAIRVSSGYSAVAVAPEVSPLTAILTRPSAFVVLQTSVSLFPLSTWKTASSTLTSCQSPTCP